MSAIAFLRQLLDDGLDLASALTAADRFEQRAAAVETARIAERRAKDAARKQAHRVQQRAQMSHDVTRTPTDIAESHGPSPHVGEGAQVVTPSLPSLRSEELEGKKPVRPSVSQSKKTAPDIAFDRFWLAYPRKVGKADARKAFDRAWRKLPPFEEEQILTGALERAKAGWLDPQFIPHATTWLNGERWTDEPDPKIQPGAFVSSVRPKSREEINREGWDYAIQKLTEEEALGQPSH